MWLTEPMPAWALLAVRSLAFSQVTNSASAFAGSVFFAVIRMALVLTRPIGEKSLIGL